MNIVFFLPFVVDFSVISSTQKSVDPLLSQYHPAHPDRSLHAFVLFRHVIPMTAFTAPTARVRTIGEIALWT